MKLIIDIDKQHFELLQMAVRNGMGDNAQKIIAQGIPFEQVRDEIENFEINGHIRDVECFRAGLNTALNVIDKYKGVKE